VTTLKFAILPSNFRIDQVRTARLRESLPSLPLLIGKGFCYYDFDLLSNKRPEFRQVETLGVDLFGDVNGSHDDSR
jgi:hypothetical protein